LKNPDTRPDLEEIKMKRRHTLWSLTRALVCLGAALVVVAVTAVPVLSAVGISQELTTTIVNRIQWPDDRDLVLQSTARAIESGYPEDQLVPVIEKSLDAGVSGPGLSRMIDILSAAHDKGLPTRSYTGKIMEGLVKKVREDRIIEALERVDERMKFASWLTKDAGLSSGRPDVLIVRTADAVAAGMDRDVLRDIYSTMKSERVNRNIAPEDVMEMVKAARGYGLNSKKVGTFAKSLMNSPDADLKDIRMFLKDLADRIYGGNSDEDPDDIMNEHMKSVGSDDDGEEYHRDDEKDNGDEDGITGDDGDDGPEDDEPEDEEPEDEEPEHD
jgi:hypothetical protein